MNEEAKTLFQELLGDIRSNQKPVIVGTTRREWGHLLAEGEELKEIDDIITQLERKGQNGNQ